MRVEHQQLHARMGKCSKCQSKQASFYDPDGGRGRYCKVCAVPGAVSRYQKQKAEAAAAAAAGGGAGSAELVGAEKRGRQAGAGEASISGKKRGRRNGALPISLSALGLTPLIVANLDEDWLEHRLKTSELLNGAFRSLWTTNTKSELDLTTDTKHQDIATKIGEELVEHYATMAPVLRDVAKKMGVNETACMGANRPVHKTPKHQHAPMGVLNLLGGQGGAAKQWYLWPPGDADGECVIIEQSPGQILWIPPGWYHEVWTIGGALMERGGKKEIVAPHWVSWCLPKELALRSLCALLAGVTGENQAKKNLTAAQKRELYVLLVAYADGV